MMNMHTTHCVVVYDILLCIINVVVIITQPMNVTVCLTQTTTATFTCVVDGGAGIANVEWRTLGRRATRIAYHTITHGDRITGVLTAYGVSVNNNGSQYRCQPHSNVISDAATLTVLGMCVHDYYQVCSCSYVLYTHNKSFRN